MNLKLQLIIALTLSVFSKGAPSGICLHAYSPEAPNDKIETFEFTRFERLSNGYRFFLEPHGSVVVTNYRYRGMVHYFDGLTAGSPEHDRLLKQYETTGRTVPSSRKFLNPRILKMRSDSSLRMAEQEIRSSLPFVEISKKKYLAPKFSRIKDGFFVLEHKDGFSKFDLNEITDAHLTELRKIDPKLKQFNIKRFDGHRLWNPSCLSIGSNAIKIQHEKGVTEFKFESLKGTSGNLPSIV